MCFGSSKTTTNNNSTTANTAASAPTNPTIQPAITNEVNAATSLASQPLQQYTGNLVAPLTDTQNEAISEIQGAQGLAQPDLTAAATYAQQGATPITQTPFSADAVNQYESPYLSDVLGTTEAAENLQDQQAQQSLQGNITAAGAWGGDRSAVLQSELAGQQATANNATNANIENTGYTQALGQFNTTNQLGLQTQEANDANAQNTAYTLGNLGTNIQNSALTGAGALLNAGTLQQQVNQENLNVPYEQYLQQQAYPYQNLDFESGILGSAAGTSGTTSNQSGSSTGTNQQSTSTPLGPQLLGLGLSAASLKSGGRTRLAPGGNTPDIYEQPTFMALPTPVSLSSYIPTDSSAGKSGLQSLSAGSTPMASSGGGGGNAGSSASPLNTAGAAQGIASIYNDLAGPSPSFASGLASDAGYGGFSPSYMAGIGEDIGSSVSGGLSSISSDLPSLAGLLKRGGRTRLADGGTDDAGSQFDTLLDSLYPGDADAASAPSQAPAGATAMSLQDTPPAWRGQATNYAAQPSEQSMSLSDGPTWDDGTPVVAPPVDEDADTVDDLAKAGSLATASPGMAQPTSDTAGAGLGVAYAPKIVQNAYQPTPDWRRALLTAGTSMMAARGGNGLSNVGVGLQAGANEYYNQLDKDNNPSVDHSGPTTLVRYADGTVVDTGLPTEAALSAKASNDYKTANMDTISADKKAAIAERAAAAKAAVDARIAAEADSNANRAAQIKIAGITAGGSWTYAGVDPKTQMPVLLNNRTGETKLGTAPIAAKPAAGGTFDPATVKYLSDQYRLTGQLPSLGMGASPLRQAILTQAATDAGAAGQTGADAVAQHAEAKTGTQALGQIAKNRAMVESFSQTASQNADLALSLMAKGAGPTGSPVIDRWVRAGGASIAGDPDVTNFNTAVTTFKNEYAKIMSGATGAQGSTDSARREADTLISPNMSQAQILGGIKVMKQEMENRRQGLESQHQALLSSISGNPSTQGIVQPNTGQSGAGIIPASAAAYLKQNPSLRGQFDAKYGAGAARKILGQ